MIFYVTQVGNVDKDGKRVGNARLELNVRESNYSTCYDISLMIVSSIEEARRLIQPRTVKETLVQSLSEAEINMVAELKDGEKYYFYDEELVYKETAPIEDIDLPDAHDIIKEFGMSLSEEIARERKEISERIKRAVQEGQYCTGVLNISAVNKRWLESLHYTVKEKQEGNKTSYSISW